MESEIRIGPHPVVVNDSHTLDGWFENAEILPMETRKADVPQVRLLAKPGDFIPLETFFEWFAKDIRSIGWTVVVDGVRDRTAFGFWKKATRLRQKSELWIVDAANLSGEDTIECECNPQRLDPNNPSDRWILNNLVADVAFITSEPLDSVKARAVRWLSHCYYLIVEKASDVTKAELYESNPRDMYTPPVLAWENDGFVLL